MRRPRRPRRPTPPASDGPTNSEPAARIRGDPVFKPALTLIGFMGSGKSVVGMLAAERAGAPFRDLDVLIENDVGMPIADYFATHGESAFRSVESRLLPDVLQPGTVVALGGGAPVDDANWRLITERSVSVYIDCEFETLWQRTRGTTDRPLLTGRSREELETLFEQRRARYLEAAHRVVGDRPAEVVAAEVLELWSD